MSILKIETGIKTIKIVGLVKKMYLNCLTRIYHSRLFSYILQYNIYNIMNWPLGHSSLFICYFNGEVFNCLFLVLFI